MKKQVVSTIWWLYEAKRLLRIERYDLTDGHCENQTEYDNVAEKRGEITNTK